MQWEIVNSQGKKVKVVDIPSSIYGLTLKEPLLHSVVKAYAANRRQGTHATKTRSLVSGGGKKPFKQKGTGNARQGSSRSPLMPGGGTAHGPQPRDYRQGLNIKARKLALCVALSDKVRHQRLILIDDLKINSYGTKQVLATLDAVKAPGKVLLADERRDDFLYRSARNIHRVQPLSASTLNAEDVLRSEFLVITENALASLEHRLIGVGKSGSEVKETEK